MRPHHVRTRRHPIMAECQAEIVGMLFKLKPFVSYIKKTPYSECRIDAETRQFATASGNRLNKLLAKRGIKLTLSKNRPTLSRTGVGAIAA